MCMMCVMCELTWTAMWLDVNCFDLKLPFKSQVRSHITYLVKTQWYTTTLILLLPYKPGHGKWYSSRLLPSPSDLDLFNVFNLLRSACIFASLELLRFDERLLSNEASDFEVTLACWQSSVSMQSYSLEPWFTWLASNLGSDIAVRDPMLAICSAEPLWLFQSAGHSIEHRSD